MKHRSTKPEGIAAAVRRVIREAESRGTSQYAIARLAKMSWSQLFRVASGQTVPTLTTAERIVNALGLRIIVAE